MCNFDVCIFSMALHSFKNKNALLKSAFFIHYVFYKSTFFAFFCTRVTCQPPKFGESSNSTQSCGRSMESEPLLRANSGCYQKRVKTTKKVQFPQLPGTVPVQYCTVVSNVSRARGLFTLETNFRNAKFKKYNNYCFYKK